MILCVHCTDITLEGSHIWKISFENYKTYFEKGSSNNALMLCRPGTEQKDVTMNVTTNLSACGWCQVAWIKADTKAILAIHEHVITNNARLSVTHNDFNTWTLNIKSVKREDRGTYMCQVNTDPMKSQVGRAFASSNTVLRKSKFSLIIR